MILDSERTGELLLQLGYSLTVTDLLPVTVTMGVKKKIFFCVGKSDMHEICLSILVALFMNALHNSKIFVLVLDYFANGGLKRWTFSRGESMVAHGWVAYIWSWQCFEVDVFPIVVLLLVITLRTLRRSRLAFILVFTEVDGRVDAVTWSAFNLWWQKWRWLTFWTFPRCCQSERFYSIF